MINQRNYTKCLLIGGRGFIGCHLIKKLFSLGIEIYVLDSKNTNTLNIDIGNNINYISGDYGNKSLLRKILQQVECVIHLAYSSVPKTSFDNPIDDILLNLPNTVSLFEQAAELNKRVVFMSSGGTIYGNSDFQPIPESQINNPISPYGITKLACEKYSFMYHHLKNLDIVCVRPSNAFGEGQRAFKGQGFIATAMASILQGTPVAIFGKEGTVRDYIYVEDLVNGIAAALLKGKPGTSYNIGSGEGLTNIEVINTIFSVSKQLGFISEINYLPARNFDVKVNILDSNKLKEDTGWSNKTSFEEAIEKTWKFYLNLLA